MTFNQREMIQDALRRYLEEKLFVYFDQLEKKENLTKAFQNHMSILGESLKKIVSIHKVDEWLAKVFQLKWDDLENHKKRAKLKEHIQALFDDDFFDLIDEMTIEKIRSMLREIDDFCIENIEVDTTSMVSKNVDSYLKQFLSTNKHIGNRENFKS